MTINDLWHSRDERKWTEALERYAQFVKPADVELVRDLEPLDLDSLKALDEREWYNFLFYKYFRWKYTAANRLASTRKLLSRYDKENSLGELFAIKVRLFSFPKDDIKQGLKIASSIHGLGIAGASGLLTLMYPEYFGTVDQFVVKALRRVEGLHDRGALDDMNPKGLELADGVILIRIMRDKAAENNQTFGTNAWTPKKIDEILWTYRSKKRGDSGQEEE